MLKAQCDIKVVLLKHTHSGSYLRSRTCPHFPRPSNHKLHTHTHQWHCRHITENPEQNSDVSAQSFLLYWSDPKTFHFSRWLDHLSHVSSLKSHSLRVFSPKNWTQRATGWRMASQNGFQNKFSLCCDQAVMTPTTQSSEIGQLDKTQAHTRD